MTVTFYATPDFDKHVYRMRQLAKKRGSNFSEAMRAAILYYNAHPADVELFAKRVEMAELEQREGVSSWK